MKIQQNTSAVETSGLNNVQDFKIAVNGKAFRILLDGIYPNKIKAVIRELCTNAFDAHSAAGKRHIPFDVTLPSTFNPVFKVRDYGVSMSHDQVMHLYSTLFQSSKENTNTEVGMLGLGSKAPFAYVDAFTTTAWLNGKKRTYRAWMGEDGVPKIALLGEEDSDEQQGVEVSIDVDPKDVKTFLTTAGDVLKYFSTQPNILNNKIDIQKDEIDLSGSGWYLTKSSGNAKARQGCVVYPINTTAIPGLSPEQESMLYSPFVIDFPIGTLDVAPSREELSYNPTTCSNIIARLNSITQEIAKKYKEEIDKAPTEWEASKVFRKLEKSGLPRCVVSILRAHTWNGTWAVGQTIALSDAFKVAHAIDPDFQLHSFSKWNNRKSRIDLTTSSARDYYYAVLDAGEGLTIFARVGTDKPVHESIRMAQSRGVGVLLVMVTEKQDAIDAFIKFMGNPTYTHTKDLPAAIINRTPSNKLAGKTKKTEIKVRKIKSFGGPASSISVSSEFVIPLDGEAYYIETKNSKPVGFHGLNKEGFTDWFQALASKLGPAKILNLFDSTKPVYFVSGVYIERVKEHGKWIELDNHMTSEIEKYKDSYIRWHVATELEKAINLSSSYSGINDFAQDRYFAAFAQTNPDSPYSKVLAKRTAIISTIQAVKNANATTGFDYTSFSRTSTLLGYKIYKTKESEWNDEARKIVAANTVDLEGLRDELMRLYPMFNGQSPRHWDRGTSQRYVDYVKHMDELYQLRKFVSEVNNLRSITGDGLDATFLVAAE